LPVTRAVDRAVRLLRLTYRMVSLHRGTTVADALDKVAGYADDGLASDTEYGSATRKFEHDKKALRRVCIPFTVRRHAEPAGTYYKITPRDLFLPTPQVDRHGWELLRTCRAPLQQVADGLPQLPAPKAAQLTTVLLAYREELGLTLQSWPISRVMLTNGPLLLDWIHSVLHTAAERGRCDRGWGGAPVPLDALTAATGLPRPLLQHVAERAEAANTGRGDIAQAVRVGLAGSRDAVSVVAPEMRIPWRPPLSHVHTLLQVARQASVPLADGVADTLCRHARDGQPAAHV
jgi:hypothetical protein